MTVDEQYISVKHSKHCIVCDLVPCDARSSRLSGLKRHNVDLVLYLVLMLTAAYITAIHFIYVIVGGLN